MTIRWTEYFQQHQDDMLATIRQYVEMESPSHDKSAVDKLGQHIQADFLRLGCRIQVIEQPVQGNQLRIEYGNGREQILVLGHFDTVKETGTLVSEPWRIESDKAYGPGIYDMKAGLVFSYFALKAIVEKEIPLNKRLVFFWNTDEELGSPSSTSLIQDEARQSSVTLVVEPSHGNGALKTSRKSGGEFTVRVHGKAAHAGNDHALGVNAIVELSHQMLKAQSWTDYEVGTTVSVGTVRGGSATNVVPDYAEAVVDVRASKLSEVDRITTLMQGLQPVHPGASIQVEGGFSKLPMERTDQTVTLFHHAQRQAQQEGFGLTEIGVGGTSDGNIAAAVGAPVLDGLGPVGDGAHATHEHILVSQMAQRTALLLRLLTTL